MTPTAFDKLVEKHKDNIPADIPFDSMKYMMCGLTEISHIMKYYELPHDKVVSIISEYSFSCGVAIMQYTCEGDEKVKATFKEIYLKTLGAMAICVANSLKDRLYLDKI